MTARPLAPRPGTRRAQALALLLLAPVCAEYLYGYDDSTGSPLALLGGLLIFVPLYGAPALLIRELARRARLGWSGLLLLATAAGILQAGAIDQSLFSATYRGMEGWVELRELTLIEPLGISAHMALGFVFGHTAHSFGAPIALVEAFGPDPRDRPWLGNKGLAALALLYAAASALVLNDHLTNEASHASAAQVAGALLVVCALCVGAFALGRRPRPPLARRAPAPSAVFAASAACFGALALAPENWSGVALALAALLAGGAGLAWTSRSAGWDSRHEVSVAAASLLVSAALAFTYDPLLGEVAALPKYLHNTAVLALVVAVWAFAARRAAAAAARAA
jgi:hypothetical protein